MSNLNRRDFLKLAGKVSLGAAALTAVPAVVSAEETAAPAWPWKYEKLDVAEVQAAVFEHFSTDGGCAAGAVGGILSVLAKHYPEGPYALLNSKMFADGAGGYGKQRQGGQQHRDEFYRNMVAQITCLLPACSPDPRLP